MSVYDHDKLIQRQFDGDGEAYKRWMQLRITESRAILYSAMAIISAKAVAISNAAMVTPAMLISIKREKKAMDKSLVDCKECILQLADYEPPHAEAHNTSTWTARKPQGFKSSSTNSRRFIPASSANWNSSG